MRVLVLLLRACGRLHPPPRVALAVRPAVDVEVAVAQDEAAVAAAEAAGVVLARHLVLEVLPLDAAVAGPAEAAVELVVVLLAVRPVLVHVEGRRAEGLAARRAHEARLVVPPRQAPVGRRDRLARYRRLARLAVPPRPRIPRRLPVVRVRRRCRCRQRPHPALAVREAGVEPVGGRYAPGRDGRLGERVASEWEGRVQL